MTLKTLPFDLERAQSGVAVCLADGTPVTIVNFNLTTVCGSYPILGRYTDRAGEDHYEIWPASGTFADEPGHADAPQDLCLVAENFADLRDLEATLEIARRDRDELRAELFQTQKELADWRKNYDKLVARVKDYASPEAFKRAQDELDASRQNYAAATLGIKELQDVVDKERRERIRLEQWQKDTLETLKDWAQVEAYIDQTARPGELGKDRSAVALVRLEALKGWALVEAWVDRDICLREIELRGYSTIVIERLKMLKDLQAILKKL